MRNSFFLFLLSGFTETFFLCWSLSTGSISSSNIQAANNNNSNRANTFPNSVATTADNVQTLTRQTGQVSPSKAAVGVPKVCNCQHGFPQVFALDPLPPSGRMNSGLLKLTCPLLVRAVDELEDDGYIHRFNEQVAEDAGLQKSILEAHQEHASARIKMLDEQEIEDALKAKLGEQGSLAFLNSGVAGASSDSVRDVKCLHAWLGDYLFRGAAASPIGDMVAQELSREGISLVGDPTCHRFCDPSSSIIVEPPKPRNKQRLRTGKEAARRKRRRVKEKANQSSP